MTLPPDRLRAMARAWALIMRGPDVPDHPVVPTPLELRAAQACWEASPGNGLVEALTLAEDVLSRSPFSTQMWPPNGMHPNTGIEIIREALRQALPQGTET